MMALINKHLILINTILGAAIGFVFLHPLGNVLHAFIQRHEEGQIHLHWSEVTVTLADSFSFSHWPQALVFIILGGLIGFLFGRTINYFKRINEQLETFSIIGENASGIIHDLNNPLTGILGRAQILKSKTNNPELLDHFEKIEKGVKRISKMIMDIKTITQSEESLKIKKESINLRAFIENIISNMIIRSKINLNINKEVSILADKDYFERVIWNLIKNADEAIVSMKNGKIIISAQEKNSLIHIEINDNGLGILKKDLKNVFTLGKTYNKATGSGIGLYNSKKFIEAHGGKIWLESEVGKGTTVHITIPKSR